MEERPVIKLKMQPVDIVLEVVGYVALAALWVLVSVEYSSLPETIPIHYDMLGKADGFGGKQTVFVMPIIASLMFLVLSFIQTRPQTFNYIEEITPENAAWQYANSVRLMRMLKIVILLIFGLIEFNSARVAMGKQEDLGKWVFPVIFALIIIPMSYFLIRVSKRK